jgi:RNA polymerase sigma factor (sigma-70 family)
VAQSDFIQLIQENQRIIHKVCRMYVQRPEDRDDLFQEITLQAWKSYPRFKGNARFSTWLYRVALNTAITHYRKQKRNPITHSDITGYEIQEAPSDSTEAQFHLMYKAIGELSEVDKALVLLYLEDYPYDDIAQMMGITPNHVAVKMNRIKSKLQSLTQQMHVNN